MVSKRHGNDSKELMKIRFRLAKILIKKYRDYKHAEQHFREALLTLEAYSGRIEKEIEFLQSVWHALGEKLQNIQNTLLHVLSHKLQYAIEIADAAIASKDGDRTSKTTLSRVLLTSGSVRRLHFACSLKRCLEKTIEDLKTWHQMFDPTWFMISRVSSQEVDKSLDSYNANQAESVTVLKNLRRAARQSRWRPAQTAKLFEESDIVPDTRRDVAGPTIQKAELHSGENVIINTFTPDPRASLDMVRDDINKLVLTLANVEPNNFGLLQCYGIINRENNPCDAQFTTPQTLKLPTYDFLFLLPPQLTNPSHLRYHLTHYETTTLNMRLSLAQSLSNAVAYVHVSHFVHKNIRPETILNFHSQGTSTLVPFLLGFERFRTADGQTFRTGDSKWERDIYRHPTRQGLWPEEEYTMLHDIYSLGVVLLEIGLWSSFIITDDSGNTSPGPQLPISEYLTRDLRTRSRAVKDVLGELARKKLPSCMGTKYADVVVGCLRCLDVEDPGLGYEDQSLDRDDLAVAVEFVENVIVRLHEISL
jgi:hypothetical protein